MVDRTVVDVESRVVDDPADMGRHLLRSQQPQLEDLAAAPNRLDDLVGLGGGKHPDDVIRRFLERLQQRVLGAAREHVDLVEDVDLHVAGGAEVDLGQEVAHVVDTVVGCGVEFVQIERTALLDRHTALAGPAWLGVVAQVRAVERLRQHSRRRGLPRPPRSVEQVRVTDLALRHRVPQRTDDVLLTADLGELLRAIAAVEGLVGHARPTLGADHPRRRPVSMTGTARRRPFPGVAARRSAAHRQLR